MKISDMDPRKRRLLKILIARRLIKKYQTREYWEHPLCQERSDKGEHLKIDRMYHEFPEKFAEYTRMTPSEFDYLLELLKPDIQKRDTNYRKSIPVRIRLYITLRYLNTGDDIRTISTSFSVGASTVRTLLRQTLPAIWNNLKGLYVKAPKNRGEWNNIIKGFSDEWQFPNCLGAIDGKHCVVTAPPKSGSLFHNYKGTFSRVLLATCDAQYRFTTVDVGGYGIQSDGGIFAQSQLGRNLANGLLDIPENMKLPSTQITTNCCLIGDEAFPLTLYMMRPYPGRNMTPSNRVFNYRLSRARRTIENAFGIMANRFRIFRRPINAYPNHVDEIILASIALHNFLRNCDLEKRPEQRKYCTIGLADSEEGDGTWRDETRPLGLRDISRLGTTTHERLAKEMRDKLKNYFLNEGLVEWQNKKAGFAK